MTQRTEKTALDRALWEANRTGGWLAKQLRVNPSQVSRWRRGVNVPTFATQRRISVLLGVGVETLWPKDEAS